MIQLIWLNIKNTIMDTVILQFSLIFFPDFCLFSVKTPSGSEMTKIFQRLINEKGVKPKKLRTDQESEYKNKDFERLLEQENIVHIFTYYETKANYA